MQAGSMLGGGTTGPGAPATAGRASAPATVTPLNAAVAWAVLVNATALWPPLVPLSAKLAYVGAVCLMVVAVHVLHEAGHVLAGLAVGLPFRSATAGLLTVRRERRGAGWRLAWDVNRCWKRVGGCVEREVTPAPGLRAALTVAALGGPLASVLGGALLLAAPEPWRALGHASLFVGVFNAVPSALLGQPSDGMLVYRLWSRRPAAVAWRAPLCGGA